MKQAKKCYGQPLSKESQKARSSLPHLRLLAISQSHII